MVPFWATLNMYVCQTIIFEILTYRNCIFANPVCLQGIQVTFVYEGHRVKVKVTEARMSKIPIPAMSNSIAHNSGSIEDIAMRFECTMGFSAMTDRMVRPLSMSRDRK